MLASCALALSPAAVGCSVGAADDPSAGGRTAKAQTVIDGGKELPKGSTEATREQPPPEAGRTGTVKITWVGDITPGSKFGLPPDQGRQQFSSVAPVLTKADLAIGNLEGTFGSGGTSKCGGSGGANCFAFQAPAEYAPSLKDAGFDVMNLANNHAFDFGPEGQRQTVAALEASGIAYTGRPGDVSIVERNGLKIATLGFAPYPWAGPLVDIEAARSEIADASTKADIVVVAIHAGAEGSDKTHTPEGTETAFGENRGNSRAFARAAIDSGADLVVGSGPHVVRGIEYYRNRVIAYSAGNFSGYRNFGMGGNLALSGIVDVELEADGFTKSGRWTPVVLTGPGIPTLDGQGTSTALVARLSNEDFGATAMQFADDGTFRLP